MAEKKTAAEKAQEALDAAQRKFERAEKRANKAELEHDAAQAALAEARTERDYAAAHPALPGGDAQPQTEAIDESKIATGTIAAAAITEPVEVKEPAVDVVPDEPAALGAEEDDDPFAAFAKPA